MALGVLNNLSAIYAENNLNNTSNSLQTVLQQLSSGSRINSGADDAAGLSLVNGLAANASALAQSETNATEGVGLLEVADGALSQVTSLLDRAITLATEASNGTLNSTQESAANQEYTSIMSEINNIGSTTTYNQQQVFTGNTIAIYTGDSSIAGSSIDNLKIRTLSEASVGDTNGAMSYSTGQDNVFIDLSNAGQNAAVTDSLGAATSTTSITVSYMSKGAGNAATSSTATINVGAGTTYANTAAGLISAINNSGLGLNATFATAAEAGSAAEAAAAAADHGGGGNTDTGIEISAAGIGTGTNGVGVVGALALTAGDTLGGTLSIVGSDGVSHNIALGTPNATDTLADLESKINSAGYGVTATLNTVTTNGHAPGTLLTFTTADPKVILSATNLTDVAPAVPSTTAVSGSVLGTLTVNALSDTLTGSLSVTEGADALGNASAIALGGTTLAAFAATFTGGGANAGLGITATLNQNAIGTFGQPGYHAANTVLTFTKSSSDLGTPSITNTGNITDASSAVANPNASITAPAGGNLGTLTAATSTDQITGAITITDGTGASHTINPAAQDLTQLMNTINGAGYGIHAQLNTAGTMLTFVETGVNGVLPTISGAGLTDTTPASNATIAVAPGTTLGVLNVGNSADTLTGVLSGVKADGVTLYQIDLTGQTLAQLETTINTTDASFGIMATPNQAGTALTFTSTNPASATQPTLGNVGNITATLPPDPTSISLLDTPTTDSPNSTILGSLTILSTDTLSGSLTIGSSNIGIGASNNTAASLAAAINAGEYGVKAAYDANTNIMTFTSVNPSIHVNSAALDQAAGSGAGAAVGALTASNTTTSDYYSVGISGTVQDTSTAATINSVVTYGGTANVGLTTDVNGTGGTATTSYSDDAGQALNGTDLDNQADAEMALNDLNVAISDIASQDGYIGAQINTLNSVSQVMTTQQENVVSAQNALQATDYASATSNMSKYEILSQTGIAALAQANSVQQEVTKLLQ
jgi:flagellin